MDATKDFVKEKIKFTWCCMITMCSLFDFWLGRQFRLSPSVSQGRCADCAYSMLEWYPAYFLLFWPSKGMGWHKECTISARSLVNTQEQYESSTPWKDQIFEANLYLFKILLCVRQCSPHHHKMKHRSWSWEYLFQPLFPECHMHMCIKQAQKSHLVTEWLIGLLKTLLPWNDDFNKMIKLWK